MVYHLFVGIPSIPSWCVIGHAGQFSLIPSATWENEHWPKYTDNLFPSPPVDVIYDDCLEDKRKKLSELFRAVDMAVLHDTQTHEQS